MTTHYVNTTTTKVRQKGEREQNKCSSDKCDGLLSREFLISFFRLTISYRYVRERADFSRTAYTRARTHTLISVDVTCDHRSNISGRSLRRSVEEDEKEARRASRGVRLLCCFSRNRYSFNCTKDKASSFFYSAHSF